jgi:hypothetical protein
MVPLVQPLLIKAGAVKLSNPPQVSEEMQTLRWQQVATAHTEPNGQSVLALQSAKSSHGVSPSTQKPVWSTMEAHTQEPPAPHGPNVSQVCPVQELNAHAPFEHAPDGH